MCSIGQISCTIYIRKLCPILYNFLQLSWHVSTFSVKDSSENAHFSSNGDVEGIAKIYITQCKIFEFSCSCRPKMHLKGFQSSVERSIKITFHALVHLPLWDWSSTSCMHIRFGHKDLGDWKYDCGNMTIHRYVLDYSVDLLGFKSHELLLL